MKKSLKCCAACFTSFWLLTAGWDALGADDSATSLSASGGDLSEAAAAFIRKLESRTPSRVQRDGSGSISRIDLLLSEVTDENLKWASEVKSLSELSLGFSSANTNLSVRGITALSRLPNLERLYVACPQTLPAGALEAISKISSLRWLSLQRSAPPTAEYAALTNLTRLEHLHLSVVPAFTDQDLKRLSVLPNLKELQMRDVGVSDNWTRIVRQFPALTNAVVTRSPTNSESRKWETVTWLSESR